MQKLCPLYFIILCLANSSSKETLLNFPILYPFTSYYFKTIPVHLITITPSKIFETIHLITPSKIFLLFEFHNTHRVPNLLQYKTLKASAGRKTGARNDGKQHSERKTKQKSIDKGEWQTGKSDTSTPMGNKSTHKVQKKVLEIESKFSSAVKI